MEAACLDVVEPWLLKCHHLRKVWPYFILHICFAYCLANLSFTCFSCLLSGLSVECQLPRGRGLCWLFHHVSHQTWDGTWLIVALKNYLLNEWICFSAFSYSISLFTVKIFVALYWCLFCFLDFHGDCCVLSFKHRWHFLLLRGTRKTFSWRCDFRGDHVLNPSAYYCLSV